MSVESVTADLEFGLGAFAQEFDREVTVVDEGNEQVTVLIQEGSNLAEFRRADPVQFLSEDGRGDAGEEKFLLAEFPEIKKVYVDLEAFLAAPCEDVFF